MTSPGGDTGSSGLTPTPGTRLGHFRVLRELGRGGFGIVHLAEDLDIPGRVVALKTVKPGPYAPDAEGLRDEASALAALHHPHILVVHEIGEGPSGIFLAEEYMPGGSVADRIDSGPLPEAEALAVARDAADALAAAHQAGIVHRDFKPANLLRADDGFVKVADFGLALRSAGGPKAAVVATPAGSGPAGEAVTESLPDGLGITGTPAYIPPELFDGLPASPRGDQFSFGVSLHEMLAGSRPFDRARGIAATRGEAALSAALPADLRAIVARAIARDPSARFSDMRAVVEALDRAILKRSPERRRTRRVALAGAALVAVVVGAWLGWGVILERRAKRLNESGRAALERGDRDRARADFVAAHSADPGYLPACTNLGQLAAVEANPTWAVTILRDCAQRFPEATAVRYNLGAALARTSDRQGALVELTKALQLARDSELRPLVVNELARTLMADGRPDEAAALVESEHPDASASEPNALLMRTLGLARLDGGHPADAEAALRSALAGQIPARERPATLVALGRTLEARGLSKDAFVSYSQALVEGASGETEEAARAGLSRLQASLP